MRCSVTILLLLFLCCVSAHSPAQSAAGVNTGTDTSLKTTDDELILRRLYINSVGEGLPLYNGVQYIRNGEKTTGFPFFEAEEPITGSVTIHGVGVPDLPLQLDLVTGQLLTKNITGTSLFVIEQTIVDSFVIGTHQFVSKKGDKPGSLSPGYYERLLAGDLALYIRWQKKLQPRPDYALSAYLEYDQVFLVKNGVVTAINGRKELLQFLPDNNGELKKFIRAENLNFKKDLAGASAATFRHYQKMIR